MTLAGTALAYRPHFPSGLAMGDDSLIAPLIAADPGIGAGHDIADIQHILTTLRTHLGMDVAFIAEFLEGRRVIRYVDTRRHSTALRPGDSHALPDSYCHYIASGELEGIVPDTRQHDMTRTMPVTDALDIANYIGVPVHLPDGSLFGSFCCFDHQAGSKLDQRDLDLLSAFADFAGRLIGKQLQQQDQDRPIRERVLDTLEHKRLHTLFQPIFHMEKRRVVGFEALTRFTTEPYRPPDQWFADAHAVGLGLALEKLAADTALKTAAPLPDSVYLSLNVSPEHLLDGGFLAGLEQWPAHRVLLEITEHARIDDYTALREALAPLREKGVDIAVDDAGAGYASFQHVLELKADIIKLDLTLIRGIHRDQGRQALAAALIRFAEVMDVRVIAEGVETQAELDTLRRLGVTKVQGYLIGKPMSLEAALRLDNLD
ncbi:hypothetical protein GCM10023339_52870 [Alloalcanivorax gelatiniphagus]